MISDQAAFRVSEGGLGKVTKKFVSLFTFGCKVAGDKMKRFFEYSYTFFGYAVIIVFTIVLCAIVALITTALITNPSRESDLANGVIPFFALFLTAPLWFSASIYCPFVAHHSFANPLRSLKRIFVCVSVPTGISFFSTALLSLLLVSRK